MVKSPTFARKKKIRAKAWSRESEIHAERRWVPGKRKKGKQRDPPWGKKCKLVCGRKISPRWPEKSRFHSKPGKTRKRNGDWKTMVPLIR